ncbi:hypothetical protein HPB49_021597 [Dermacentor silvarum]|uniref:Uncharacterized protein n=1 Tax=Dermacentor silvarum TaxID=543639 RepID=A0ACB8CBF5_DERSI|nr:hypothetical protein HPB49_021597 [Dermacentor silvarum]
MSSRLNGNAKHLEKFEIIQWNCRGFRAWKKRSHLQLYLPCLGDMPALLALQEPDMDAKFSGYSTFQGGPSTCILGNKAYTAVQVDLDLSTEQEYTMVRVLPLRRRDPSIHIFNIYSPPYKPRVTFSEIFLREIELASKEPLVIVGDFNAASLHWGYYFEKARGRKLSHQPLSNERGDAKAAPAGSALYQGTTAQLADTLCDGYLCRTGDPTGPEYTYFGKPDQQLDAPFELDNLKAALVKMRREPPHKRPKIVGYVEEVVHVYSEEELSGVPGVIGCIDGTYINIRCPARKVRSTYINRHNDISMTLQAVCDHEKRFLDVTVGNPSKMHDAKIYRNSRLAARLPQICASGNYHILGDAAYPLRQYLLTPYRDYGKLTSQQKSFNARFSATRVRIENAFGDLSPLPAAFTPRLLCG